MVPLAIGLDAGLGTPKGEKTCVWRYILVGGLEHFLYGMSSFPLTFIFSRWLKPPTSISWIGHEQFQE